MTKEQYNAQRTKLLNDMRAAIDAGDIETSNRCRDEINQLDADYEAAAQARANLAALENGNRSYNLPDVTPAQTNAAPQMVTINNFGAQTAHTDPSETNEYRTAFMNFVCRGTEIPADLRASVAPMLNAAATTTTTDASAVIPTTITREIIREMKSYGNLYAKIRKLNVQGGVEFPILTLKPTANWIGESKSSDDQKLTANTKVSFSYYGLECKIAQTLLASIVTFDEFQQMFVPLAVEAIVAAKEKAIISGTGSGQFRGITKDNRVPTKNVVVLSPDEIGDYSAWHKKVIAKIPKAYRKGEFVMAQGTFDGYIDGMVDKNGQPIGRVNYGIDGGETYRFCGKPVETVEDDIIANFDAAAKDLYFKRLFFFFFLTLDFSITLHAQGIFRHKEKQSFSPAPFTLPHSEHPFAFIYYQHSRNARYMQQKIETEVLRLTQAELKTVLDSSGIPFAYRAWKNGHDLPFGVFYFERDNPFAADGIVYAKKTLYALELYTAEKDPDTEAALEKALTAAGIFYSKSDEIYIDEEQMFYVIYEIEV